jgi:hypothetical protein
VSGLGLHPQAIAARAKGSGIFKAPLGLCASLTVGAIGFMIVSVAGFAPWAFAGRALHRVAGEVGLYLACALVFIGLSGVALHRLIIGPGSLWRFYALFTVSFSAYALGWTVGWMSLRGHVGSATGLLLGTSVMGWLLVRAFDSRSELLKVIAALFLLNAAGYFIGGWVEGRVASMKGISYLGFAVTANERKLIAMLLWGLCYGLGLGAGLGFAFYCCQAQARRLLGSVD